MQYATVPPKKQGEERKVVMKIALNEIKAPHKRDRDIKNISELSESIKEIGLVEPIVLNERNEIISGRRRFYAAKELKLAKVDVIYFEREAIDQELAVVESNLMFLPLGDIDHDQALARKKKLYEQKYPDTRRYASGDSGKKPFTHEVSNSLGITKRSVELAIARAEKASPLVAAARREGKLSPTVVNALVRMPTSYQDKVLPLISGKNTSEVKKYVELALEKDVDFAIARISKTHDKIAAIDQVEKYCDKLQWAVEESFSSRAKVDAQTIRPVLTKVNEIISLLEKFVEVNTPVHKPILRKQHSIAS